MESRGLTRRELEPYIGSRARVAATAELLALRNEYAKAFARFVGERAAALQHPAATTERRCVACGTTGQAVADAVQKKVTSNICPLCDTALAAAGAGGADSSELKSVDEKIAAARKRMESVSAGRDRLSVDREEARRHATAAAAALRELKKGTLMWRGASKALRPRRRWRARGVNPPDNRTENTAPGEQRTLPSERTPQDSTPAAPA